MNRLKPAGRSSTVTDRFEVFFDGQCPLCAREINFLKRLDRHALMDFTDIAAADFDGPATVGLTYNELMASIHGRLADGSVIEGVEVFRQLYARTALKPLVPITRLPGLNWLLDRSYTLFAWMRFRSRGGPCEEGGQCQIS